MAQPKGEGTSGPDFPRYGWIYDVNLDPTVGSEIGKRRPALIVSNDLNNQYGAIVTVVPFTGQPSTREYPFEVSIPGGIGGLTVNSRAKCNQIRTLDKSRLANMRGKLPPDYLTNVGQAIKVHLNLD